MDRLQTAEKKVLREIAIMKKCKHGQIVQLLEVIDDRLTSKIFMGASHARSPSLNSHFPLLLTTTLFSPLSPSFFFKKQ